MGLKLTLLKTDNHLGYDFINAYWSIDSIEFSNYQGATYVSFMLNAYPTRDAKYLNETMVPASKILFGGPFKSYYSTIIHEWSVKINASEVFPEGIPLDESSQKDILYEYVKSYTELPFEDVFEENQEPAS